MPVDHDDLRRQLQIPTSDWTLDDVDFAAAALKSARVAVVSIAGPDNVAIAEETSDQQKLDALDEAQIAWAKLMFSNPERVLQRRQGTDTSVSFADSSLAAIGVAEVKRILSGFFRLGRVESGWVANDVSGSHEPWIVL